MIDRTSSEYMYITWQNWVKLAFFIFIFLQNHLDLHAVLWLETYLVKWPKTVIVVSHAREFLNTVTYSPSLIFPVEDKSIID